MVIGQWHPGEPTKHKNPPMNHIQLFICINNQQLFTIFIVCVQKTFTSLQLAAEWGCIYGQQCKI